MAPTTCWPADTAADCCRLSLKTRILELGTEPRASTPDEIGARLQSDIRKWASVIEQAQIEKR